MLPVRGKSTVGWRLLAIAGGAVLIVLLLVLLITTLILDEVSAVANPRVPLSEAIIVPTATPTATATPTPLPTATPTPFVNGSAEYLVDAQSGRVFYSSGSHLHLQMGSVTKIMTAVVALERGNLSTVVSITQSELDEVPLGASTALLVVNDRMYLSDLLYALLLPSGCDAAIVIAHAVGGSTANFVAMMNDEARRLGLRDTHFTNPHGAFDDSNHYTSAADLAILARHAMNIPFFAQIVRSTSYHLKATINHHDYPWQNTNIWLNEYPGADGIKTGSTATAGYCLVFSATRNGHRLIGIELGAPGFSTLFSDATRLMNLGFSRE
ncbi:MAG TPA: D-alanyl-D-alanine carboxypeptidase [Ktedonobacterales bacterium]|nr:D-alanyl-D-alanine carboxypeptidase [Ktedonobacterales bacterium]